MQQADQRLRNGNKNTRQDGQEHWFFRDSQFRHGFGLKEFPARLCDPACPPIRGAAPGTVGRNPGVGVHLPVELGNQ